MTIRTDPERDPIVTDRPALIFRHDGSEVLLNLSWCIRAVYRDPVAFYPLGVSPALLAALADSDLDGTDPHDQLIAHARKEIP